MVVPPDEMERWHGIVRDTGVALQDYLRPYITPVGRVIDHNYGELEGSGSYIESMGKRFLITNEHVARRLETHQLSHQFNGCENVFGTRHDFISQGWPQDIAVGLIDDDVWNHSPHQAQEIPKFRFDMCHRPVDGELFLMCGFAAQRARFLFGTLITPYSPYLAQEPHPRPAFLDTRHFALAYNPDRAQPIAGNGQLPGDPHGFSGSLVWNTRRVECRNRGIEWSPELATVTGIIHSWLSTEALLVATRVEEILKFLHNEVPQRL